MERVLEPEVMDTAEEAAEYDSMDHTEPNASFLARRFGLGGLGPGALVGRREWTRAVRCSSGRIC